MIKRLPQFRILPRPVLWVALCTIAAFLAVLSFAAKPQGVTPQNSTAKSPQTATAAGWAIVTSPSTSTAIPPYFRGTTCLSASDCWAVGYYTDVGDAHSQTLIEHWNGSAWTVVSSPNAGGYRSFLYGVTCTSASDCWAVGAYRDVFAVQTLIVHWNGNSWSVVSSPNTSDSEWNYLSSISCVSASDCWAVGHTDDGDHALVEHWNGSAWAIVASPNESMNLSGVTCPSASDCWAVGDKVYNQAVIEHWNGSEWAIVSSPDIGTPSSELSGVTCASASQCWAVGSFSNDTGRHTLTLVWNGAAWAIVASPNTLGRYNFLSDVTCASASDCWTVGESSDITGPDRTLIERWNGTAWTIITSPNSSPTEENYLAGVTCASASDCRAVGTTIEHWNGSAWEIVPSTVSGTENTFLFDATCASASDCWAVGYLLSSGKTLIEHWNGTTWTIADSPNATTTRSNYLFGVTCASSSQCWAIGYYKNGSGRRQTLMEQWTGSAWTIVASPNATATNDNYLADVTCTSASQCWAVGSYTGDNGYRQTLIEQWNGSDWTIVISPNTNGTQNNYLADVACTSASECWAAGFYDGDGGYRQTLIARWDGIAWTIVSSPNATATEDNYLSAVTCISASQCWAVGSYTSDNGYRQTLIEQWNGSAWTIVASPNTPATKSNYLYNVTCSLASHCWAVGESYDGNSETSQTLIAEWDGNAWTTVNSPNAGVPPDSFLNGIICASASRCWAVGSYYRSDYANSGYQTLIEQYSPTIPPLTSVASRMMQASTPLDVNLPLTGMPGIECRSGGVNGNYSIVFSFANDLTSVASVRLTNGTATIGSGALGPNPNQYTIILGGVTNQQYLTVALDDVLDSQSNAGTVEGTIGVLVGDTNGDGSVNSADISQTKSQSGQALTNSNFREDLNVDGSINSADISLVKSKSGTALP